MTIRHKFLPGEPAFITIQAGNIPCIIRSHASRRINSAFITYTVECRHKSPLLKGKIFESVPVGKLIKINGRKVLNWNIVKGTCGWMPEGLQHRPKTGRQP